MEKSLNVLANAIRQVIEGLEQAKDWQDFALKRVLPDLPEKLETCLSEAIKEAKVSNSQALEMARRIEDGIGKELLRRKHIGDKTERQRQVKDQFSLQPIHSTATATGQWHRPTKNARDKMEPIIGVRAGIANIVPVVQIAGEQHQNRKGSGNQTLDPRIESLCENYNASVVNPQQKTEFIRHYSPIRFGVANAMARRQDLSIEPVFQKANDGDYYAIKIDGQNFYSVIPRFDLTFEEFSYGPGAMGYVFACRDYNPQSRYRRLEVLKPAIFQTDSTQQNWKLREKGELNLGHGE